MQIRVAATHLIIFWALVQLKKQGKFHTVKEITDCIFRPDLYDHVKAKHPPLDAKTIRESIDQLEKWGSLKRPYKELSGRKSFQYYDLNPNKIPSYVYQTKPSNATISRWNKELREIGFAKNKSSKYFYEPSKMIEEMGYELVAMSRGIARKLGWERADEIDEKWIYEVFNEKEIKISRNFLLDFHNSLVRECQNMAS